MRSALNCKIILLNRVIFEFGTAIVRMSISSTAVRKSDFPHLLIIIIIIIIITAIEFSLGGSSPYTSTESTNKNKHIYIYIYTEQYKNTVQTKQNTVNTSTHITKIPTQLSKHPHITKPTHTHTYTLQNKLEQPQYKTHTKLH